MLKQEELDEIVKTYASKAEELGVKVGYLLKANGKTDNYTINNATVDVAKFRYATYPHLELTLLSNNQPISNLGFYIEDYLPEEVGKFEKGKIYPKGTIFNISDFKDVIEAFKIGGIDPSPYFAEKKDLEERLAFINEIIENNNLKED